MRSILSFVRSRTVWLLGVCSLALVQTACAHSVAVEPSVVVQARLGGPVYGSIYAPLYGAPRWWWRPAPVVACVPTLWPCPTVPGCPRAIAIHRLPIES